MPLEDGTETLGPEPAEDLLFSDHRPGTVLADRYTIVRRIGRGGYATVYLADDAVLRRQVALKVLHPSRVMGHGLARLRREVLVAREVRSPYLVEIYDLVIADGIAFLTMEWVEGETLQQRLHREGSLSVDEAIPIARGMLRGLNELHGRTIVHRDVKPSNVLIAADGSIKLLDFGLALRWGGDDTRITATEAVVGTAEYLAPEQILGKRVGPETDLYAFGATLYEMVTGEPVFGKGTSFRSVLARLERGPKRPSSLRPEVPGWLDQVILRLLERKPEDRYQSTGEVAAELESRSTSWVTPKRRRRAGWGIALALVLLAVATGLWAVMEEAEPGFSHVAHLAGARGVRAVATDGSILWSFPDLTGKLVPARLLPGEPERLVGFLSAHPARNDPEDAHRLLVIDPQTGKTLRTVELQQVGRGVFGDFSNRFAPDPRAVDIDGDGYDEILVTYVHMYWPSYILLYEPRIERSRMLFAGGGHHRPALFHDVTGDGKVDMLALGWANRLGYVMGLAAVRIDPWVNEEPERQTSGDARTPDPYMARSRNEGLIWYELLPHDTCLNAVEGCIRVEDGGFSLRRDKGSPIRLTFDGFRRDLASDLPVDERQAARRDAFDLAAEAVLLRETATLDLALDPAHRAVELARRAVDPGLEEYTGRTEAILLARAGRTEEAERQFRRLYESSEIPPNIAFDAARAFHLEGDLERAIRWYREVFHTDPDGFSGRPRHEALLNLALAFMEQGEPQRALEEVERLAPAHIAAYSDAQAIERFFRWRSGLPTSPPPYDRSQTDLVRYLVLETLRGLDAPPSEVLPLVEEDLERTSSTRGLLLSLEAELLRQSGRPEEARPLAREAWEITRQERDGEVPYRAFAPWVEERVEGVRSRSPADPSSSQARSE